MIRGYRPSGEHFSTFYVENVAVKYSESITWTPVEDGLPDDAQTVLIVMPEEDEPVWLGFHDDGQWYEAGGMPLDSCVTAWAPMPTGNGL